MKKLSNITNSILLSGVLLLSGCSERGNSYTPGTNINLSLDISESDIPDSTSSLTSSDSTSNISSSENSFEQSSDVSAEPVPVEFTEEDRELQEILSNLLVPAEEIYSWMVNEVYSDTVYKFRFSDFDETKVHYYYLFSGIGSGLFERPTTCEEMEDLMLEYFTADRTDKFLSKFSVCSAVENSDGTYTLKRVDKKTSPLPTKFIEINGQLYRDEGVSTYSINIDLDTVTVNSKTDDTIEFTYLCNDWTRDVDNSTCLNDKTLYLEYSLNGTLKYEREGWKFASWGWLPL